MANIKGSSKNPTFQQKGLKGYRYALDNKNARSIWSMSQRAMTTT